MTESVQSPTGEATIYLIVSAEPVQDALGGLLRSAGYRVVVFSSALIFLTDNPSSDSACVGSCYS